MKLRFITINGSWINDDLDVMPNIKLRFGIKQNESHEIKSLLIAFVWLKFGFGIAFSKIKEL